jgi:hypothetical protein
MKKIALTNACVTISALDGATLSTIGGGMPSSRPSGYGNRATYEGQTQQTVGQPWQFERSEAGRETGRGDVRKQPSYGYAETKEPSYGAIGDMRTTSGSYR